MWFMHSGGPPQLKHQKSADMKYLADNFQDNCQGWNFSNCKGLDFSGCQGRFFIANWPRVVQSIKSNFSDKSKMPRSHKLYLALLNLICNKKLWRDNHLHQYKDTIYNFKFMWVFISIIRLSYITHAKNIHMQLYSYFTVSDIWYSQINHVRYFFFFRCMKKAFTQSIYTLHLTLVFIFNILE